MPAAIRKVKAPRVRKAAERDAAIYDERAPAERWQRGAEFDTVPLEHRGHRVQRVLSGLLQLEKAGRIGPAEVSAAIRWRRDYELSVHGARDPEARGSGSGGVDMWMAARVDTATRYRQAAQPLGMLGDSMLRNYVAEGLSLRQIHVRMPPGTPRERLSKMLADTLERLATHYADVDKVSARGILPRTDLSRDSVALAAVSRGDME